MRYITLLTIIIAALLPSGMAGAQNTPAVVIKNATIHTVSGDVHARGSVLIGKDGKIQEILTSPSPRTYEGATVVDASGKVVTPGFIAISTALGVLEIGAVKGTRDADAGGDDPIRAAFRVADGFNPSSLTIPVARPGGITSALVVPSGGLISGQSAWIDLGHPRDFATMVRDRAALHIHLGQRGSSAAGGSRASAVLKLRELFDDVAFYRKNRRQFDENRARSLSASRLDLKALQQAQDDKLPVFISAHRASDIVTALKLAEQFGLKPIITGATEAWRVIPELKAAGCAVVVNSTGNLPGSFERLGARTDNIALLQKASVPVILSVYGFSTHNIRALRQEAGNAVRAGLDHAAALEAVTLAPARALGMEDYGQLAPGKIANLVIWSGDPFELSTKVEAVYIGGKKTSLHNRQRSLFERYRTLPKRGEDSP